MPLGSGSTCNRRFRASSAHRQQTLRSMISERTLKTASSPDIELHRSHFISVPRLSGGLEIRHRLALANIT
jgi:hypothetical protein